MPFLCRLYTDLFKIVSSILISEILKDDNITVNCLHPGVVATGFASQNDSKFQKFLFKLREISAKKIFGDLDFFFKTDSKMHWKSH